MRRVERAWSSPLLLLLLATCACAQLGADFGEQEETYALRDGSASGDARLPFSLGEGLVDPTHDYQPEVEDLSPTEIVNVVSAIFQPASFTGLLTLRLTMNFPGQAILNCSILLPSGVRNYGLLFVNVIGIVLFDGESGEEYTGRNARALRLSAGNVTTVDAVVFGAPQSLDSSSPLDAIRLRLSNRRYKYLLPWDHRMCRINTSPASLHDNCSMAFSEDFTKFSFRVPSSAEFMTPPTLSNPIELVFEWAPAARFPSSNSNEEPSERTDDLTTARLRYPSVRRRISSLPGWKIAIITVMAIIGSVTLVIFASCCICAARHRSADRAAMPRKVILRRLGRHHSTLVNMEKPESFSQIEDFLPPAEPRSRSVYSQDTLGPVSGTQAPAEDELIPDEQMLAALMARDSVGTAAKGVRDDDLAMLTDLNGGEEHVQQESCTDDDVEAQLEVARKQQEGRQERNAGVADAESERGGAANGGTRTAKDRMAFGAACERMKVVNMLVGPVSRGLISGHSAPALLQEDAADEAGSEEEDEKLRFSSEELDMDLLDVAQAMQGGGGGDEENSRFEGAAEGDGDGVLTRVNRTR
ncbi:hypothetical protein FGB62_5g043 [Gracilaria domingensis]|nr:hypothetical protein FGB62_5g043 [Gracilaria domingensis]